LVRLLAEVIKIRKKEGSQKIQNFDCETLYLNIRIKGPARKTYRISKGIRGKTFTIARTCLRDWSFKKGVFILLNTDETR